MEQTNRAGALAQAPIAREFFTAIHKKCCSVPDINNVPSFLLAKESSYRSPLEELFTQK